MKKLFLALLLSVVSVNSGPPALPVQPVQVVPFVPPAPPKNYVALISPPPPPPGQTAFIRHAGPDERGEYYDVFRFEFLPRFNAITCGVYISTNLIDWELHHFTSGSVPMAGEWYKDEVKKPTLPGVLFVKISAANHGNWEAFETRLQRP